ncbi:PWWP domain-containing protein 1-like [Cornus florida]|uniref:PWWP domain-containing protein 1-like n=1 Tax=Cornus florida TaxID=4283 RepID=UPI00289C95BD|nr:PWWP domain-containing protein 1-like [Cornus florida]
MYRIHSPSPPYFHQNPLFSLSVSIFTHHKHPLILGGFYSPILAYLRKVHQVSRVRSPSTPASAKVMNNNDFGLDRVPDGIEQEYRSEPRVSVVDDVVDSSSDEILNGGISRNVGVDIIESEEIRVLQVVVFDNSDKVADGGDDGSGGIRVFSEHGDRNRGSDVDVRVSGGDVDVVENGTSDEIRGNGKGKCKGKVIDCKGINEEMKPRVRETKSKNLTPRGSTSQSSDQDGGSEQSEYWKKEDGVNSWGKGLTEVNSGVIDHKFDARNGEMEHSESRFRKGHVEVGKPNLSQYDPMLSVFDEFAANGKGKAVRSGPSTLLRYGYEIGDMVWGKVKSHPWWPGHIYNEAFACSSVRRTKRAGHLLVAFFGDSSYGWFDPAEVIPFDPNFGEKSRQLNSKNFVKAVEEAVDEASRRCGLGLACRCRSKYNFWPTSIQGYFSVDVVDYEPGAVYSANQIKKARNSFQPRHILAFIKHLALMPTVDQPLSIDYIKNKATVISYRKAVFEEFDETYAQAFGAQPVRPSHGQKEAAQPVKEPYKAPPSGPQVIAEALGKVERSAKPKKFKDQGKKDNYLFKRRDERDELETHQINLGLASSSVHPTNGEGSSALAAENYVQPIITERSSTSAAGNCVLQKSVPLVSRKSKIPGKHKQTRTISRDGASALHTDVTVQGTKTLEEKSSAVKFSMIGSQVNASKVESSASNAASFPIGENDTPAYSSYLFDPKSSLDKGKGTRVEMVERKGLTTGPASVGASNVSGKVVFPGIVDNLSRTFEPEVERMINFKDDPENSEKIKLDEGYQQSPSLPTTAKELYGQKQVHDGHKGVKKGKALKHTTRELSSDKSAPGEKMKKKRKKELDTQMRSDLMQKHAATEKSGAVVGKIAGKSVEVEKKKKRKKELDTEMSSDNMQKHAAIEKSGALVGKVAGKVLQVGWAHVDDSQVDCHKKFDQATSSLSPDSARMEPMARAVNSELEHLQLLSGLQSLALNPFHAVEKNNYAFIQQIVLRFRTLVYKKSSVPLSALVTQSNEDNAVKFPTGNGVSDDSQGKNISNLPSLKPSKPLDKPDDPTKGGFKRSPSDRLEGMAAKRLKKISDLKTLAAEKKGAPKTEEAPQGTVKERVAPTPTKPVKADSAKKMEPPAMAANPTTLVMKFPPHTNLPSGSELKARLARFGPLDHSGTRIFYKSSTCRVVFLRKLDAQAAYKHLSGNNSLFGNLNIRCHLREDPAPESESGKVRTEDPSVENLQSKETAVDQRLPAAPAHQPRQQPAVQLKSCLKKSTGDETATVPASNGGSRGTSRVKFMLTDMGEQLMVANKNNNGIFPDGASSSHAMDFNSKNFQNIIPPPSPSPHVDLSSSQLVPNNLHNAEVVAGISRNFNTPTSLAAPIAANIDIAPQMISLLTRCNDVVTNMKGFLGYVPYHPL